VSPILPNIRRSRCFPFLVSTFARLRILSVKSELLFFPFSIYSECLPGFPLSYVPFMVEVRPRSKLSLICGLMLLSPPVVLLFSFNLDRRFFFFPVGIVRRFFIAVL